MNREPTYRPDLHEGAPLPPRILTPTAIQLFRFSAATANPHLIHYNTGYAQSEGYSDIVVQSHLHASFLAQSALDWAGPDSRLRKFRWENRRLAVAGDQLTVTGEVIQWSETGGDLTIDLELTEHNQDGLLCAPAWATITLPTLSRK